MQRYTFFSILNNFCIFACGMKRVTNIFFSSIMLAMMLLGVSGLSVEKCSCTGKISLALPTEGDCCPDEGGCMTLKSMQLSDYVPTMTASVDMPMPPMLFPVFPSVIHNSATTAVWRLVSHCALAPPGALAHTVDVLRV